MECTQSTTDIYVAFFLKAFVIGHATCKKKREAITHHACHQQQFRARLVNSMDVELYMLCNTSAYK